MDARTIRTRLQELAFLNSDATIWFRALQHTPAPTTSSNGDSNGASPPQATSSRSGSSNGNGAAPDAEAPAAVAGGDGATQGWEKLHFSGGLREYAKHLNRDLQPMHEPLYIKETVCTPLRLEQHFSVVWYAG